MCIQGAEAVLSSLTQKCLPLKMTQNDISCYFESFLGAGGNFWGDGANTASAPCMFVAFLIFPSFSLFVFCVCVRRWHSYLNFLNMYMARLVSVDNTVRRDGGFQYQRSIKTSFFFSQISNSNLSIL